MKSRAKMMVRFYKAGLGEILAWSEFFISFLPGRVGWVARSMLFKRKLKKTGSLIRIGIGVRVLEGQNIQIGDNFFIGNYSGLYANNEATISIGDNVGISSNTSIGASDRGHIQIGDNVQIAGNVVLRASDHEHKSIKIPIQDQGHTGGVIVIGDDCWLGANVVVTRNVKIGSHSIIAAGAVVTRDVEPFSIVAGVPAKLVRKRE